ncbi:glycosyltransferase family 4 protein [Patescibacteria group bacterium]|nr:glycosyltransferase family 4 protein [Patescibacteria group bacterium]
MTNLSVAIDISPLKASSGHKVRGVGFYIENLKKALLEHFPQNRYQFFTKGDTIEKSTDVVHYPYFEPFFLSLPIIKRYKTVVTVHDLTPIIFPKHFPSGIKGALRWQMQKISLLRSDGIITDSYTSQEDIAGILGIEKKQISVAYLAAAEEFRKLQPGNWKQEIIKKYNLPEKFVLYVGDVTWNKNLPRLIEAIKEINLTLVLVGRTIAESSFDSTNPWNKDILTVQKMIKGDKRFIRLGFILPQDLVSLYNTAAVFVFPSIYEGFGLPIVEAMQSGCPVVLSEESCLPEIGGKAVYYVNPHNTNSIANGIGEVFFSGKLQKDLSEKGLTQAKKFSWKKTAEETIKAYQRVIKSSSLKSSSNEV